MKARRLLFFVAFILFSAPMLEAQKLPNTHLFMFDMKQVDDTLFQFTNPMFLSNFNLKGYNNQPYFVNDDELYLTVQMPADTSQTDIYSLHLKDKRLTRVTRTYESEFSPRYLPTSNDVASGQFSVVRIEQDNRQLLWKYPFDRSGRGEAVFRNIDNVGYYQWINPRRCALFLVGTPHRLVVADALNGTTINVAENIGRGLERLPGGDLIFVDKSDPNNWVLRRLDTKFYRTQMLATTLPNSEDFAVLPDGSVVMGQGTRLYRFRPLMDNNWREIADFSYYGFSKISRLAVNGGRLVLVAE